MQFEPHTAVLCCTSRKLPFFEIKPTPINCNILSTTKFQKQLRMNLPEQICLSFTYDNCTLY